MCTEWAVEALTVAPKRCPLGSRAETVAVKWRKGVRLATNERKNEDARVECISPTSHTLQGRVQLQNDCLQLIGVDCGELCVVVPSEYTIRTEMDFVGQKLSENLSTWILWIGAALAFLWGYSVGDFLLMAKVYGVFCVLALIVVVPDWPFYNRNPITWCTVARVEEDLQKAKEFNNAADEKRDR